MGLLHSFPTRVENVCRLIRRNVTPHNVSFGRRESTPQTHQTHLKHKLMMNGGNVSISQLLTELTRLGVRIEVQGDVLRYAPRSAVTPELASRMKTQKSELVAILRSTADLGPCKHCGQLLRETLTFDGFLNLECSGCRRCLGCRPSTVEIADRFANAPFGAIPVVNDESQVINEVDPCPECGSLDLWRSAAGDLFGRTPGRWHCMKCDPPKTAPFW